MPTYEYRCAQGHEFERFQRMSDEPLSTCPTCGAEAERLLSAGAGFLFKGSGFYITDYRSDSWREAAKRDGSEVATGASPAGSPEKSGTGTAQGGSGGGDGGGSGGSSSEGSPGKETAGKRTPGKESGAAASPRGSKGSSSPSPPSTD